VTPHRSCEHECRRLVSHFKRQKHCSYLAWSPDQCRRHPAGDIDRAREKVTPSLGETSGDQTLAYRLCDSMRSVADAQLYFGLLKVASHGLLAKIEIFRGIFDLPANGH
jgi:hypothetical protein